MGRTTREALNSFVARLARLRQAAGAPSLNRLAALSAHLDRPLARSTISDKLTGRSMPNWDFVVAFVTACEAYARKTGVVLSPDLTDLAKWDAAHWRLLHLIDDGNFDERLSRAAHAELARRTGPTPGDEPGGVATADPAAPRTAGSVPRQLPPAVPHLAGRMDELRIMTALLNATSRTGGAPPIVLIDGMAGVGKTTLAVYWAHRVADRFPGGQLYLNLRGFEPVGAPVAPPDAVRALLEGLGVAPARIPSTMDAQLGLFRTLLAARHTLVLLDNAADAEQVRPLLPGSADSFVVVTSRNQLAGLVAANHARPMTLEPLSAAESYDLLAGRIGAGRLEDPASNEILAACGGLPLALSVVGARAATRPRASLQSLAAELQAARHRLDGFAGTDPATNARVVFSWSYDSLEAPTARLFRLLGQHPGPELTAAAAASLAATPRAETEAHLNRLRQAHLIAEPVPGRFTLHDLLRCYAAELAAGRDPEVHRRAALHRLLDHYLHSANAAAHRLNEHRDPISLPPASLGSIVVEQPDADRAMAWFTAERATLQTMLAEAAPAGFPAHAWKLGWTLVDFLDRQGHWQDLATVQRLALEAAAELGDHVGRAHAHRSLGRACSQLQRFDEAQQHLQEALRLFGELGDRREQATTHCHLDWVFERQGRLVEALAHAQSALELSTSVGDRARQATALNNAGWYHALLGEHEIALRRCGQAMDLFHELGNRHGAANTWDTLGYINHELGRYRDAVACYRRAVAQLGELGDHYFQAESLSRLGDTYHAAGDDAAAVAAWRRAVRVFDRLQHPEAAGVRMRLQSISGAAHA